MESSQESSKETTSSKRDAPQPRHDAPYGMEPYDLADPNDEEDLGALSNNQQDKLNNFKIKTRLENELYMRNHPEIQCLLTNFLGEVLRHRPDNVHEYAANYFSDTDLAKKVETLLAERKQSLQMNYIIRNTTT